MIICDLVKVVLYVLRKCSCRLRYNCPARNDGLLCVMSMLSFVTSSSPPFLSLLQFPNNRCSRTRFELATRYFCWTGTGYGAISVLPIRCSRAKAGNGAHTSSSLLLLGRSCFTRSHIQVGSSSMRSLCFYISFRNAAIAASASQNIGRHSSHSIHQRVIIVTSRYFQTPFYHAFLAFTASVPRWGRSCWGSRSPCW